jgi:hypothetical protein
MSFCEETEFFNDWLEIFLKHIELQIAENQRLTTLWVLIFTIFNYTLSPAELAWYLVRSISS